MEKMSLIEWFEEKIAFPFRDWIFAHYTEPWLWCLLFFSGVAVFFWYHNTMHGKE